MAYAKEISRANPVCLLILVDQSGSMFDSIDHTNPRPMDSPVVTDGRVYTYFTDGPSKAQVIADVVNRFLFDLIIMCTKGENLPRDYFHVGVIGYGEVVRDVLPSPNADASLIRPLSAIASAPQRVERRLRIVEINGHLREESRPFPIWIDPVSRGGTPMCAGLKLAHDELQAWLRFHPRCHPPILIHITDGEGDDGDPLPCVHLVTSLGSAENSPLVYNLHITADFPRPQPIVFPDAPVGLPSHLARQLFTMSSTLTPSMRDEARSRGYSVTEGSRGYVFNAGLEALIDFLYIGTQPTGQAGIR